MKIPERVNRIVSQNSSELLLVKVRQLTNMFKVNKKGMFQECYSSVFIINLENISEVCGGV